MKLLKMSAGLVALSLLLILYGQFLLHTRCDESGCVGDANGAAEVASASAVGSASDASGSPMLQRRDEEPIVVPRGGGPRGMGIKESEVQEEVSKN